MWKPLELEVHGPINYVASPRRQCYKSVVKGTPADWPARQGLLPANGSVYPSNCFLNKPPLQARADGQNGECGKGRTVCGCSGSATVGSLFHFEMSGKKTAYRKSTGLCDFLGTSQLCCTFLNGVLCLARTAAQSGRFEMLGFFDGFK